jgi:hypothetical protein
MSENIEEKEEFEEESEEKSEEESNKTPQKQEDQTSQKNETEGDKESKKLQTALAQKEHYREKNEKNERRLRELEGKAKESSQIETSNSSPMEIVRLAKALGDFSDEEIEFITRNSEDKTPEGIINASKDEWVKTAIEAKREKVEKESKNLEPSTKVSPSDKDLDDISPKELKSLSKKERDEILEKAGWGSTPIKKR